MRRLITLAALICLLSSAAWAQSGNGQPGTNTNCANTAGTAWVPCGSATAGGGSAPSNGATSANQTTQITAEQAIQAAVQATLAVSAASLPLPAGASTSALQTTGNSSLSTIATNTGSARNPAAAAITVAGCTVGVASAQCLAASTATVYVQVENNASAGNIACAWGMAAVLASNGSLQLAPGQSSLWGPTTGGPPTQALNCIAANASEPLYLEYR